MKKYKLFTSKHNLIKLFILGLFILMSTAFTNSYYSIHYDFTGFKNKSYYQELFAGKDRIGLNDADEIYEKGKKYMIDADQNFRKAEGYKKLSETEGKSNASKAERYEKKGIKLALKAYETYFLALDKKFRIYADKLSNTKFDNGKRHLKAEEYSIDARSFFLNGSQIIQEAKTLKGSEKLEMYKSAYSEQIKAIEKQEIAFMILMNDPVIKDIDKIEEDGNNDSETDNEDDTYKPGDDPNVYISKEDIITEKIEFSDADLQTLKGISEKIKLADIQMKEVDEEYKKIDAIRKEAENTEDEYDRNMKLKMASSLEDMVFDKMINAAESYYTADKTKYEIYLKYLPDVKIKKLEEKAKKHEEHAVLLHGNASKLYNKTKFYTDSKTNRYIQLMNAVQSELSAIRELENAFLIYFEQQPDPLEDLSDVGEENENGEPGKTADNDAKMSYNFSGSYVYTLSDPNPKPLVHQKGIVFKVQIGLFKELLPMKQYGNYSPISFDTFKNNPYKRFMLGEYRSNKSAEWVLEKMKAKGFTDAFIVAFENGERKTLTYGISKIVRNEAFLTIETNEMDYLTGKTVNDPGLVDPDAKVLKDVSKTEGLAYYIQLGNYSSSKTFNDFNGIQPIYTDYSDNSFKYLTGTYKSYDEAKKHIGELNEKGFKDVFVTCYLNGKRISLSEALKNKHSKNISDQSKPEIYYTVQVGLYSHKLNNEELKQYNEIEKKYPIRLSDSENGLYLYSAGKFNTYEEANTAKTYIKGLKLDGFIIAYKNGVKISVSEAVTLQK